MSWTDADIAGPASPAWTDADVVTPGRGATGSWDAPTLGQSAGRQGRLLVRALASAVASPATLVGDAVNKAINGAGQLLGHDPQLQMPSQMLQRGLNAVGLPEPATGIEKFTQGMAESAPAFALPAGFVPQAIGNATLGAIQAAPGAEGTGALVGGAFGGAGHALARTLSGLVKPTAEARVLMDRGVGLTPGQAAGAKSMVKRVEDTVASWPIASHFIKNAQTRAVEESNVAAAQAVTDLVSRDIRLGRPPREAIESTRELVGQAYDFGLSGMSVPSGTAEKMLKPIVGALPDLHPMTPMRDLEQIATFVELRLGQMAQHAGNGQLTGPMLKQLDSEIGQQIRNLNKSPIAADKTAAPAWFEVQKTLREVMELGQPDAEKLKALQNANAAYPQLLALEKALLPGSDMFNPRRLAGTLDKADISTGPLRDVSNAMTATLPNTVANSGTPERLLMAAIPGALFGGGAAAQELGYPTLGAGAMAAGALGSRTGARLMTGATKVQKIISPEEARIAALLASLRPQANREQKQ